MWQAEQVNPTTVHVVPLDDLIEHNTGDPESCPCGPTLDDGVVIHHSLDGREFSEDDYQGPAMPTERNPE